MVLDALPVGLRLCQVRPIGDLVTDTVPRFHGHERRREERNQLLLPATLGDDLGLSDGEGASSLHDTTTGDDPVSPGRCHEIDLELCTEYACARWHQCQGGVPGSGVRNRRHCSCVNEAVLPSHW